ncbi:MAG: zf-TFIIB domain-containing protein [Acidobacteria bacterium]|nr:zf-TFIIB domain-containing protein [Acidobacteriota bacterium]
MAVESLRCPSCGAPAASSQLQCAFCGSQLATVSCPECFAAVSLGARHCPDCGAPLERPEGQAAELQCPDCAQALARSLLGGLSILQCHKCGGVWLGREDFEALGRDRETRDLYLQHHPPAASSDENSLLFRYRPCPACGRVMNRTNYARISGVIVDTCREDGLWFDRDELGRILRFIEAGGLHRAAEREKAEIQVQRAALRQEMALREHGALNASGADPVRTPLSPGSSAGLLGDALVGVAEFLWGLFRR